MAAWYFCVFFLPLCTGSQNGTTSSKKLFFMIIDGLPWDKVTDESTFPNLVQLRSEGASVEYLKPVFPTIGYPNYFSLLTGLYPEEHGIVDEYMYDHGSRSFFVKGGSFGENHTEVQWFQNGELFWSTAQNKGQNVAVYGWSSCNHSEAAVGPKPEHCFQDRSPQADLKENYKRVDEALALMADGTINVAFIFINNLDYVGRQRGIHSQEFNKTMQSTDELVGYVRDNMVSASLADDTNMIVLSTHGLASLTRSPMVLDISNSSPDIKRAITFFPGGARVAIYPESGTTTRIFNNLYRRHKHISVYWKWNMPVKWHIRNGRYTAPIWVIADPGWAVAASTKETLYLTNSRGGLDGYDPDKSTDMRGVFMAVGPSFKQNYTHAPISIVDIYNLLCRIVDIKPSTNSGQLSNIADMLETNPKGRKHFTTRRPLTTTPVSNTTVSTELPRNNMTDFEGTNGTELVNTTHVMGPMDNLTQEIIMILTNNSMEGEVIPLQRSNETFVNGTDDTKGHIGMVTLTKHSAENETIAGNSTVVQETTANETLANQAVTPATTLNQTTTEHEALMNQTTGDEAMVNQTIDELMVNQTTQSEIMSVFTSDNTTTQNHTIPVISNVTMEGSGFGEDLTMVNMTELLEFRGSGDGSGEVAQFHNTSRHRRSDSVQIIESIDDLKTPEEINETSLITKTWCECTGFLCTTRLSNLCDNESLPEQVSSRSKIHQSTPGVSVGTDEDQLADIKRAEVEVHDWQDSMDNFTGRSRDKRKINRLKEKAEIFDDDLETGSGANFIESTSTNSRTSHGNRSDLSIHFVHKAQNAQRTSNVNTANVRLQRYDLGGGFLVQNRYNRPTYNLRLVSDTDDQPSASFLDTLKPAKSQAPASKSAVSAAPIFNDDPSQMTNDPEDAPLRVNQFNVANGGQATQFIIEQPVLNLLIPQQEPDQPKSSFQRLPATYKTRNNKPRIEILSYDTQDNV